MKKLLLMLLVFSSLLFSGCESERNNQKNANLLSAGFDSGEPESDVWLGFTSEKTIIKEGENLALKVYYGTIKSYPEDFIKGFTKRGISPDEIHVDFVINYVRYSKELLPNGENYYTNPEYTLNYTKLGGIVYKTIEEFGVDLYPMRGMNSQYEEIVLSSDYFTEKMGAITFSIIVYGVYQEVMDIENGNGVGISLYYKNNDGIITLYDSYYKFRNSIIK